MPLKVDGELGGASLMSAPPLSGQGGLACQNAPFSAPTRRGFDLACPTGHNHPHGWLIRPSKARWDPNYAHPRPQRQSTDGASFCLLLVGAWVPMEKGFAPRRELFGGGARRK